MALYGRKAEMQSSIYTISVPFSRGAKPEWWGSMVQLEDFVQYCTVSSLGRSTGANNLSTIVFISSSGENSCSSACHFLLFLRRLCVTGVASSWSCLPQAFFKYSHLVLYAVGISIVVVCFGCYWLFSSSYFFSFTVNCCFKSLSLPFCPFFMGEVWGKGSSCSHLQFNFQLFLYHNNNNGYPIFDLKGRLSYPKPNLKLWAAQKITSVCLWCWKPHTGSDLKSKICMINYQSF